MDCGVSCVRIDIFKMAISLPIWSLASGYRFAMRNNATIMYVPALPARETYLYTLPSATVRSISNVDPIRADYVIRAWNGEEYYSQRSCHEEVNALLKMRKFARKALHQRKAIIVIWTRRFAQPTEC